MNTCLLRSEQIDHYSPELIGKTITISRSQAVLEIVYKSALIVTVSTAKGIKYDDQIAFDQCTDVRQVYQDCLGADEYC